MKILVLGGTQFIGRHLVEVLHHAGHAISILNRGRSRDELPPQVERLRGDRDDRPSGLAVLTDRAWDVCIDVSGYTAQQVRASAEMLRGSVGRYLFISAVSVYGNPACGPVFESQPCVLPAAEDVTELTSETYGRLKVACEKIVAEMFPGRCTLLRPQIVAGPYDPLDRFSYWVRRATQSEEMAGGEMLVPGDGSDSLQYIDAGDVARFVRTVCEEGLNGTFNLAGPRLTWAEFATILGARDVVWVPKETLAAAGVTEFELPLYRPTGGPRSSLMYVSNERAVAAGLRLTAPAETVRDVRTWLRSQNLAPALSPEREAELIEMSRRS